jgi:isoleucyl-tRNA synthetase
MFDEVKQESFSDREKKVLKFWKEKKIFEKSVESRRDSETFVFYDGPPFATGLPHYGHLLAGTIKDVIPRFKTMKGYHVPRRFGWDCHGLPVEQEIEKARGLSGAKSIEEFGIGNFNEECRQIVLRYTEEWKETVLRMGRWIDFDNTYRTMDKSFMESVWWVFKQLYDKGLVYEGYKVMPFSAKLGTPLSNFEAGENYKEIDDPSVTVKFPLDTDPSTSILAWTTTPWTLVSNLGLMVGPDIDYVKIYDKTADQNYILAKERLQTYFEEPENYTVLDTLKGKQLEGLTYEPLFSYFAERKEKGAFRVILEDEVATDEGTGIVHTAPAFGEVDFYACQKNGIDLVCPVDSNGQFTEDIPEYTGQFVKDADKDIMKRLKKQGKVVRHETLHHRYPFCWRSDTPLIYRAMTTWFVAVEKVKDKMIGANDKIHWTPDYIKHGRFGKWLEGARDWAISRNRYWGTPIPLWRSDDGEIVVIGSVGELEELTGKEIPDIHRHFIDDLTFTKNGKEFKRIPEVFDCWFESGSMPYAQNHYPFENEDKFDQLFPADFIAEGLDQTRGWFYTLTVLGAALFDSEAFKNVIVNGIILAEDGQKMSKRLKNYPEPAKVIEKYGADAIRLYMLDSPAAKAADLCFSERGVELELRQVLIPLWNAYSFFITYARICDWTPDREFNLETPMDKWIVSMLNKLIHDVEEGLNAYDLTRAVKPFVGFINELTNWYIRRSRRRFWEEKPTKDRAQAFATLYYVLVELSKIAAPFIPYISEMMYLNLRSEVMPESVHLCHYPQYHKGWRDVHLEEAMAAVQTVVSLGHSLRKDNKLKVRQPLPTVHIASPDEKTLGFLDEQKHLILDELNVKNVEFIPDEKELVSLKAKPNFKVLGKEVGKLMPKVQKAIQSLPQKELEIILNGGLITLEVEGVELKLGPQEVLVDRTVREGLVAANEGLITVALDTALTEELEIEGLAREVVNKVNTMRRDQGFEVTDRIHMTLKTTPRVQKSFENHGDTIKQEVLAKTVSFDDCEGTEWDLNGEMTTIKIEKA